MPSLSPCNRQPVLSAAEKRLAPSPAKTYSIYAFPGVASVAFCECIPIEDALLARGFYLIRAAEPLVALSTDVLDFFCVLKDVSNGPMPGIEVILSQYLRVRGYHLGPGLLMSSMNSAVTRYYQDHYQHDQLEPRNVERRDGMSAGYNGRGAQSPIAADEPSTGMALEETQVGQTRGDARNEVNEGCRIYHHNNVPEDINFNDVADIMAAQPSPLIVNRSQDSRFVGSNLCFAGQDITPLLSADACLPAGTIDGCAMLVQHLFDQTQPSPYAIFPPYAWQAFVRNDGNGDAVIWNHSRRTRFWEKQVWMIPVHYRGNHWFLGVIDMLSNTIRIFDSLYCKTDMALRSQQLIQFVYKMLDITKTYQQTSTTPFPFGVWDAFPAVNRPLQSNAFDCGLWVVACVAAVIRGFGSVVGGEIELPRFREWLYAHALQLQAKRT